MRVAFLDFGAETSGCLLIVIHHLLVDDISSQILFEDLVSSYQQLEREQATSLPPKTTSYRYWAHRLSEYAQEHTGSAELAHWTGAERESIATLPCDYPDGLNNVASAQTIFIDLTAAETTRLVVDAAAVYKTNIEEMLLSSLAGALSRWGDRARLLVAVDHPGREAFSPNLDVSRTIGSFAFLAPLVLTVENPVDSVATLKRVKEQLRAVPQNGFAYGLCRYFGNSEARRKLQAAPAAEVSFRYRGQTDDVARSSSAFRIVKEETGPSAETGALRAYVLEVSAKMSNGQLLIALTYSEHLHERASIEALAEALREALLALVTESSTAGWQGYTPSDFPEAKLDQKELDNFLAKVRRSSQRKGQ
jgi:non-ribosomal peptide synthase protein (TIGR01720 family)